ncbi:hypothetical protein KOG77_005295 [Streptococcus oralis]
MKKSVGVRGAYLLFSKEEEIELQERYSKEGIEILFLEKTVYRHLSIHLLK